MLEKLVQGSQARHHFLGRRKAYILVARVKVPLKTARSRESCLFSSIDVGTLSTSTARIMKDRSNAGVGVMSLMVDNAQINTAYLKKALNDAGPLCRFTAALLKAEQKFTRGMPILKTGLQDKGFLRFIKHSHLMNRLRTIRASGLELEATDDAMLTALGQTWTTCSASSNLERGIGAIKSMPIPK